MATHPPDQTDAVSVAWVLGLHGTSGQVRARIFSDAPQRFEPGQELYCNGSPLRIASSSRQTSRRSHQLVLKFEGVDSPAAARPLVGQWLTIPPETVAQLSEGEYFHFQLLGLRVVTDHAEELGEITEVIQTGSNDVYVVKGDHGEVLVPAIASVVREIDLDQRTMVVHLMEGMR